MRLRDVFVVVLLLLLLFVAVGMRVARLHECAAHGFSTFYCVTQ